MFDLIKIREVINLLNSCAISYSDIFGNISDYFQKKPLADDESGPIFDIDKIIHLKNLNIKSNITKRAGGGFSPSCPSNKTFFYEKENEKISKILKFFKTPDEDFEKSQKISSDETLLNQKTEIENSQNNNDEVSNKTDLIFKKPAERINYNSFKADALSFFNKFENNTKEKNESLIRKNAEAKNSENKNYNIAEPVIEEEDINAFGEKFSKILSEAIKNRSVADNY